MHRGRTAGGWLLNKTATATSGLRPPASREANLRSMELGPRDGCQAFVRAQQRKDGRHPYSRRLSRPAAPGGGPDRCKKLPFVRERLCRGLLLVDPVVGVVPNDR